MGHMQKVSHFWAQMKKNAKCQLGRFCPEPFNWKILANLYFCISYDSIRYKAWFGIFLQKALRFNQTDKADFCWEAFLQKENDKNKSLWNPSLIQKVQIENNASHIKCSTLQAFFELERFKWANNNNNNRTTSRQGTVQSPLVDLCYDQLPP